MATVSPTRPTRRAARKPLIVEESEDELSFIAPEEEEVVTPAPKRSPKKASRRQTTANVETSSRKNAQSRRAKTGEGIEPSQIFDPEESVAPSEPASPSKKVSPRKRKSVAAPRGSRRMSNVPDLPCPLPTPDASMSPEPQNRESTPLADITSRALNRSPPPIVVKGDTPKIPSIDVVLEKPADIVIKLRTQAAPAVE